MAHEKNKELLDALNDCAAECNHCASACLEEKDVKMLSRCIRLTTDCADICRLTAALIARSSEHANYLLQECVEVCHACSEECEKHSHMEHCRRCAEECRNCADVCAHPAEV